MGEWQPIETAPKDGSVVLLWGEMVGEINGPFGEEEWAIGQWNGGSDWTISGGDAYSVWMKPTHWQPLPAPPKK